MKTKILSSRFRTFVPAFAALAMAAAPNGCSCSTSSSTTPDVEDAATPNDSATATETSTVDAATCDKHLPSGFTNVEGLPAGDTHTGYFGMQPTMALDENDDPMFAYFKDEGGNVYTLYFTRWDPCAGAFTTPLLIETLTYGTGNGGSERNASIAYDLSTKEIGIVYNQGSLGTGPGDGNPYVTLASEKAGQTTFTLQLASAGLSSVVGTTQPTIAMGGGQIYIAFVQGNYNCGNLPSCEGLQLLTSTATNPPDGGVDPDGGVEPHYFTEQAIPSDASPLQARGDSVSLAIDSSGGLGIAFFEEPGSVETYNTTLRYWHTGMASAVSVTDTNNQQNDSVQASLVFEGTKPRILAKMSASATAPSGLIFETSDDGTTWAAPISVSEDNGAGNGGDTVALAMDGAGNGIATSDVNGGPSVCTDPYLAQTTSTGATWTACVSDIAKGDDFTVATVSAAYGQSRSKGKFIFSFQNTLTNVDPAFPNGVWLYQSP